MVDVRFDTYYRYADLTKILQEYAATYPDRVRMESIGKSYEGRDIWLAIVTAFATGGDREKPALWVDGNIHATEVSTSSACLYLLKTLVDSFGSNPDVTRAAEPRLLHLSAHQSGRRGVGARRSPQGYPLEHAALPV